MNKEIKYFAYVPDSNYPKDKVVNIGVYKFTSHITSLNILSYLVSKNLNSKEFILIKYTNFTDKKTHTVLLDKTVKKKLDV